MVKNFFTISTTTVVVLCILLGCYKRENVNSNSIDITVEESVININHNNYLLSNNLSFNQLIGIDSLIHFEPASRTFYLFDLNTKSTTKLLEFSIDGPNFMEGSILDFDSFNGKYFILTQNYLHISNQNGEIEQRVSTNEFNQNPSSGDFRTHKIQVLNDSIILTSKWIRAALYSNSVDDPPSSIFAQYNRLNGKFEDLPIFSPTESQVKNPDLGYFGLSEHYFLKSGCLLIFNFRFSSKIYLYNVCEEELEEVEINSQYLANLKEPIETKFRKDPLKLAEYISSGVNYSRIHYMNKHKLYARIAMEMTLDNEGMQSIVNYIQLFDENFQLKKEIRIDKNVGLTIFTDEDSIYLLPQQFEEGKTKILRYEVSHSR